MVKCHCGKLTHRENGNVVELMTNVIIEADAYARRFVRKYNQTKRSVGYSLHMSQWDCMRLMVKGGGK